MMIKPKTWTTADKRRISIREMTDEHLLNTLLKIEKNPGLHEKVADKYVDLLEEAKWRKLR